MCDDLYMNMNDIKTIFKISKITKDIYKDMIDIYVNPKSAAGTTINSRFNDY
jgi:hypothetical protein